MIMLEVELKLRVDGVREKIADCGNADPAVMMNHGYAARGT